MKNVCLNGLAALAVSLFSTYIAAATTGQLTLTDSAGTVTPTYQSGESVYMAVADADVNADSSVAETMTVLITSETEDTGTPFSATAPVASSGNVGDGVLTILKTSYNTKDENWTVLAVSSNSFLITGSVSGQQTQQYNIYNGTPYISVSEEVSFNIVQGNVAFKVGDSFSFSTTAGTIVGETITLTETGVDTGIFSANVSLNEAEVPNASDGILDVQSGDLITVFYDDAMGDWGDEVQSRTTALYAATVVRGSVLLNSTIWIEENSPYLVTGDVTISSGATLTIMPGVDVLFLANSDDVVGGQTAYDSELIVQGTLNIAGTAEKGVTLTSSNREPLMGDWGGIRVESGSLSITNAFITYSGYGVDFYNVNYKSINISDSSFISNGSVIKSDNSSQTVFTLSNNEFKDNGGYIINTECCSPSSWVLANNIIENNNALMTFYYQTSVSLLSKN
jgi:hypothetical protein